MATCFQRGQKYVTRLKGNGMGICGLGSVEMLHGTNCKKDMGVDSTVLRSFFLIVVRKSLKHLYL